MAVEFKSISFSLDKYNTLSIPSECLALLVALSNSDHKETLFFATGAICTYRCVTSSVKQPNILGSAKPVNAERFAEIELAVMMCRLLGRDDQWGKRHSAAALANLASLGTAQLERAFLM